jgi:hypothetical protein
MWVEAALLVAVIVSRKVRCSQAEPFMFSSRYIYGTYWKCNSGSHPDGTLNASKNVDWNCNGSYTDLGVSQVLRRDDPEPFGPKQLVAPTADWPNLIFKGGQIGGLGAPSSPAELLPAADQPDEMSKSENLYLQQNLPFQRCAADLNSDGVVDQKDLDFVKSHMGAHYGDPNYDRMADYNGDGVIDVKDLAAVAQQLGCKSQ